MRLATTEGLISNVALCMICFCHNFFVAESSHQQYSYQSYDYHRREERQLETETEDDFDETDRMIMVVVFFKWLSSSTMSVLRQVVEVKFREGTP